MRANSPPMSRAKARSSVVLPTPTSPCSSTWPRANTAIVTSRMTCGWPMTTVPASRSSSSARACQSASRFSGALTCRTSRRCRPWPSLSSPLQGCGNGHCAGPRARRQDGIAGNESAPIRHNHPDRNGDAHVQGSRRLLDALHRQPPVQEGAAPAGARPRACTSGRHDGRQMLDGVAGLWCVNAGHARPKIVEAIARAGRRAGLRAAVPDGATRRRSSWPSGWSQLTPPGHEQGLLHQLGLRVGRHRAEDGARLPPRARRRPRARG